MISSRSMRGDDDSGIVGAVAMMSIDAPQQRLGVADVAVRCRGIGVVVVDVLVVVVVPSL